MRSEASLLGADLVSWNASHDVMASTAEIVNEDKRIVCILSGLFKWILDTEHCTTYY
jgi:hypothetical protein